MELKKRLLACSCALAVILGGAGVLPQVGSTLGSQIEASAETSSEGWSYSVYANKATITGYTGDETAVKIPSEIDGYSVTRIGDRAFLGCSSLTSITIPDSVTFISDCAFSDCSSLTSITIPNSVTSIGGYAFENCSSLTSITISNSVTSIGVYAFENCSSLTSIIIPNSVTSIGVAAFSGCSSLTSITIPNSVTSIDSSAFYYCSKLTSITIPNSVTRIGDWAFYGCSSLTSITIPDSVTSIGESAFEYCSSLTSITIPNSVTSIDVGAFAGCNNLTIKCYSGSAAESYAKAKGIKYVLLDSIAGDWEYSVTANKATITRYTGDETAVEIPSELGGYSVIGVSGNRHIYDDSEFFYGAFPSTTKEVIIPDSVTSIGKCAFEDCTSLTSITIPDSVTSIGEDAFYHCTSLANLTIPSSVKDCDPSAFSGCNGLETVVVGLKSIYSRMFYGRKKLIEVTILNGTGTIEKNAFAGCTGLTEITIPLSVITIDATAFDSCDKSKLTIYCYNDSFARMFAVSQGIKYVLLDSITYGKISLEYSSYTYSGKAITLDKYMTVKDANGKVLVKDTDYTVSYKNNTKVGYNTATVTVTGKGNYTGSVSKKFTIKPAKLAAPTLTQGKGITVSWKADSSAVGYQVQYCKDSSFTKDVHSTTVVGKTTVNLTSIPKPGETWYVKVRAFISSDGTTSGTRFGNYSSAKSITLKKALKTVSIEYSSYTYTGSAIKPKIVSVKDTKGNKLTTSDYTVSYSNNTKVGKATIKITGKGKYQGTLTKTFVIKPKPGTLTLTTTKGAFKASWPKNTSATGYEVQYSKDKTFKTGVITYGVSKNTTTSVNFSSKPNSGETWYVKYRAYLTVNGTKYGNYSAVKSIKVK